MKQGFCWQVKSYQKWINYYLLVPLGLWMAFSFKIMTFFADIRRRALHDI